MHDARWACHRTNLQRNLDHAGPSAPSPPASSGHIADIDADLTTSNGRLVARMAAVAAVANPVPTRVPARITRSYPNREARSDNICQA